MPPSSSSSSPSAATQQKQQHAAAASLGRVAVVGAGVSGLAAAYRLQQEGVAVTVFESSEGVGGRVRSNSSEGFLWDEGANTMVENSLVVSDLISDLNISSRQLFPRQQNKRYILKGGQPVLLPTSLPDLITSPLLSPAAKLQLVLEPFLWKQRPADVKPEEESVGSFLSRHIGQEPVDVIVDPFCAGTSGSDPKSLSMAHAFPDLFNLEQKHGSLLVGAIKSQLQKAREVKERRNAGGDVRRAKKGIFSFEGGMQVLPSALLSAVGESNVCLSSPVSSLSLTHQSHLPRSCWTVATGQEKGIKGPSKGVTAGGKRFDAVILTAPLSAAQTIRIEHQGVSSTLAGMGLLAPLYRPMALLINAFRTEQVARPLEGFGVLVPSSEARRGGGGGQEAGFNSLGTLFSSSMFPDRAPAGSLLFTTFIGGSRDPSAISRSREDLNRAAVADLRRFLSITGEPVFSKQVAWREAFPEYGLNYSNVLKSIEQIEQKLPGLYYAGNHRGGLAVGRALISGWEVAERVLEDLKKSGGSHIYTMA